MNTYHFHYYKDGQPAGTIWTKCSRQRLKRFRRRFAADFKLTLGRVRSIVAKEEQYERDQQELLEIERNLN